MHSFGISVVTEIRDRKEEYGQSENPACSGDNFLWFIVLSRLDLNNIGLLCRVGNTSNLEWRRRRYPWANTTRFNLSEKAMSQPDLPPNLPNSNPGKIHRKDPLSRASYGLRLNIPFSPFLSLAFVWTQLHLFILRPLLAIFSWPLPFIKDNLHLIFWKAII